MHSVHYYSHSFFRFNDIFGSVDSFLGCWVFCFIEDLAVFIEINNLKEFR